MAERCRECGKHPLVYVHCDRWDCPLLLVRRAIEMPDSDDLELVEDDDDEVIEPFDYAGDYDLESEPDDDDDDEC